MGGRDGSNLRTESEKLNPWSLLEQVTGWWKYLYRVPEITTWAKTRVEISTDCTTQVPCKDIFSYISFFEYLLHLFCLLFINLYVYGCLRSLQEYNKSIFHLLIYLTNVYLPRIRHFFLVTFGKILYKNIHFILPFH